MRGEKMEMTDPEILRAERFGSRDDFLRKREWCSGHFLCLCIDEEGGDDDGKADDEQCKIFSV